MLPKHMTSGEDQRPYYVSSTPEKAGAETRDPSWHVALRLLAVPLAGRVI